MNQYHMLPKPKKRSKLRLKMGMAYYTAKRYWEWLFGKEKYSKNSNCEESFHLCFEHRSPLIKHLKDLEMYLQFNKVDNLKIASQKTNGLVLRPGETFSFWRAVGRPTKRKGYKLGMVSHMGRFIPEVGGGLCQLSDTIQWISLHTPLTITQNYRHGFDVFADSLKTVPFGCGATCYYNYIDLCVKNETQHTFRLHTELTEDELVGYWSCSDILPYMYKVYEAEHRLDNEAWGGYSRHNVIRRKTFDCNNTEVQDELVSENHVIMLYAPFLDVTTKTTYSDGETYTNL